MLQEVVCGHCGATNQVDVPDGFTDAVKWECTPCGGISTKPATVVDIVASDSGGTVEAAA